MNRQSVNALSGYPQDFGLVQSFVDTELFPEALGSVLIRVVPAGADLPSQQLTKGESVTYLLSGQGEWSSNDDVWSLSPGEGVYSPLGTHRCFSSSTDKDAILLEVWGNTIKSDGVTPPPVNGSSVSDCRISRVAEKGGDFLQTAGGFIDMGVHWLATAETVGARSVVLATSTFTPGGSHQLHRHTEADEFFLVMEGGGTLLTEHGAERQEAGEMVYLAAGEWHGFTTDPGVTTRCVYGYLGAGSLEEAGYEIREVEK